MRRRDYKIGEWPGPDPRIERYLPPKSLEHDFEAWEKWGGAAAEIREGKLVRVYAVDEPQEDLLPCFCGCPVDRLQIEWKQEWREKPTWVPRSALRGRDALVEKELAYRALTIKCPECPCEGVEFPTAGGTIRAWNDRVNDMREILTQA